MPRRLLFISSLAMSLVASNQVPEDPVMRIRAQRAASLGVGEGDLPALPKGVVEPPPLPPPEAHVKDARRGRRAKAKAGKASPSKGKARRPAKAASSRKKK